MEKKAFLQDFISPSRLPSPTSETSDTETLSSNAVTNSDVHHEEAVTSPDVKQPRELETEEVRTYPP